MKLYIVKAVTSKNHILAVECISSEQAQSVAAWAKRSGHTNVKIQPTVPLSTKLTFVTVMQFKHLPEVWKHEIDLATILGEHSGKTL